MAGLRYAPDLRSDKQKFKLSDKQDPSLLDVTSLIPNPIGDVSSGLLGLQNFKDGDYKQGVLNSLGVLPLIPSMGGIIKNTRIGDIGFDSRFDARKLEQDKLNNLTTKIDYPENNIKTLSLADYEGRPFITSMSDRTNVGKLQSINGVKLSQPVDMQGGQDYMFNNDGQVWASAKSPVNQITKLAKLQKEFTGKDPLFMGWRMAPTGGDFANMTGETMLRYMNSNMGRTDRLLVNDRIKEFIPNFKGIHSEDGINQFRTAPDKVRKQLKNVLDKEFRNDGGLSIGEARLAVADPNQLTGRDAGIMNVGEIFSGSPIIQNSGHKAYPKGIAGQGLGRVDGDFNIFQLLPNVAKERGILDVMNPSQRDIRALQMKPYGGILTEDILKSLGY